MRTRRITILLSATILLGALSARAEDPVNIAEPGLKAGIEARLGIANPTPSDMLRLDWVNLSNRAIRDLTGLEYAENLVRLDLWGNEIVDISPLTGLTNLRVLTLYGNPLSAEACLTDIPVIRANNAGIMIQYDGWPEQQHALSISASSGGCVALPGEGVLTFNYGQCVPVEAVANAGYEFTHWSGTAVDADMVLDASTPHTSVVVEGDYSLTAHFKPQDLPWTTVYLNDFEAEVGPEWSHDMVDATPVGARRFLGQFGNDTVTLTLSGLPPHTHARVSFDLFVIRTWDGDQQQGHDPRTGAQPSGIVGPDIWKLEIPGAEILLEASFANWPYYAQSYPANVTSGSFPAGTGASEVGTLRYVWEGWFAGQIVDSVYHLSFPCRHGDDQVSFQFSAHGLQGMSDESWGLDNVRVEVVDADVELATSSTNGGSVAMPGEGTFVYNHGTWVPVEAVAGEGYQFTHWSGTAVEANAMLDSAAIHTSVLMDADYSLTAHFKPQDEPWSTVYVNDFEDQVGAEWSHDLVDATPIGERRFLGQFNNDTVTLTLMDLPPHANVRLTFDLFLIHSWDGDGVPAPPGMREGPGPDLWSLAVNGDTSLLETTFDNHTVPPFVSYHRQSYPYNYPGPGVLPQTGAAETGTLGYVWDFGSDGPVPADSVYHLSFTIDDSAPSIQFDFAASGLQQIIDETWGLDNVRVEVLALVPDVVLTVSSTAGGSVVAPGEGTFAYGHGESVAIEAVAEAGYSFTHWSGSAVEAGNVADPAAASTTVLMDGDCELVANFAVNHKTLTISSTTGGSVLSPGEGTFQFAPGESVIVQASTDQHYYFTHWSGTAVEASKVANPNSQYTTVVVDDDYTLVANFRIGQHRLTVSAGEGGEVKTMAQIDGTTMTWLGDVSILLDHGTPVTLTAIPDGGWFLVSWSGTMGSSESNLSFVLTQDCSLEAIFDQ